MSCSYFGYGCLCPECQEKRKMDKDYLERIHQLTREELEAALIREAELRGEWEKKALGIKSEDPDPCRSEVERVEVQVQTCIRTEDNMIVSRGLQTIKLDPHQFTCNQSQQIGREYGRDHKDFGRPVEQHKIGKPFLVLQGVVIGAQNDPLIEPAPPELDVLVEKVANVVTFKAFWKGDCVMKYEVTEQALLVENMQHHTGLMIDRIWDKVGRDVVSQGQIRKGLMVAVSNGMGIPIEQM